MSAIASGVLMLVLVVGVSRSSDPARWVVAIVATAGAGVLLSLPLIAPAPAKPDVELLASLSFVPLIPAGFVGVVAAPVSLALAALARSWRRPLSAAGLLLAALLLVVVLASGSRTALLALVAGTGSFSLAAWRWSPRAAVVIFPLGTVVLEVVGPGNQLGRSVQYRLDLWLVSMWLNAQHAFGIGFGAFVDHGVQFMGRDYLGLTFSAHNLLYQTWADLGPVGVAAVLAAVVASVTAAARRPMPSRIHQGYVASLAAVCTLGCAESVVSLVVGPEHVTALAPFFFVLLALPFADWRAREDRSDDLRIPLGGPIATQLS